ncbi:hypothetical protein [Ruegeria marina]|uniref:Uncharacterized protein n=1 Tax=Ruegeria marina TaxID=639004 RepID=A0A1G7BD03_9RHOB|nr:hypothetical protein [Ruegeria marina]SDE24901.1 hypothetical protein SAMN04488239_11653 [Ruegeria marina]
MTRLSVPQNERGLIRLYALNMRPEEARFLREPGAVAQLLGLDALDMDHVEVFPVSDLEELGLYGYLTEGCGISEDQLDRAALAAHKGWMLLLRSRAFGEKPVETALPDTVERVGEYREAGTDWSGSPIETASALPHSAPRLSPREARRKARNIGFSLFIVVMALIIGGLTWLIL